jgi:DNA replication protein DnaC
MNTTPPNLPNGHKLVCLVRNADPYWLAKDDKGYEYVVGCTHQQLGTAEQATQTTLTGHVRQWSKGDNGAWARTDSESVAERYAASLPAGVRSAAWVLPSGLPADHNPAVQACKELATAIVRRKTPGGWLQGGTGAGKTQCANWIGMECASHGMAVARYSTADIARLLRASYGSGSPEAKAAWNRTEAACQSADLCILDDLGAEGRGDDLRAWLLWLVDLRANDGLATVCTSNLSLQQLGENGADQRMVSRLSRLTAVQFGSRDYRKAR